VGPDQASAFRCPSRDFQEVPALRHADPPRERARQILQEDPLVFVDDQQAAKGHVHPKKARELRWLFHR
jgi:hypothetical protein